MDPRKIQERLEILRGSVGDRAYCSASYDDSGPPCRIHIYPNGICASGRDAELNTRLTAETWADAFTLADEKWAERKANHRASTIRRIALTIIKITADRGECKDADLRMADFSDSEISELGQDACEDANTIASNGPFAITFIKDAANAA